MCGLFGFVNYGKNQFKLSHLAKSLGCESAERGMDATGIAYLNGRNIKVEKAPVSASEFKFDMIKNTSYVMGHTRLATQGTPRINKNNHPFLGKCKNTYFALAHNGMVSNVEELHIKYNLPASKIETDSFVLAQFLSKSGVSKESIKDLMESIKGSASISVLDSKGSLFLAKGNNPLHILDFTKAKIIVYASTKDILIKGIMGTFLEKELLDSLLKNTTVEEIPIEEGDILEITSDNNITRSRFSMALLNSFIFGYPYNDYKDFYNCDFDLELESIYKRAIKLDIPEEEIDELFYDGYGIDDISSYLDLVESEGCLYYE